MNANRKHRKSQKSLTLLTTKKGRKDSKVSKGNLRFSDFRLICDGIAIFCDFFRWICDFLRWPQPDDIRSVLQGAWLDFRSAARVKL